MTEQEFQELQAKQLATTKAEPTSIAKSTGRGALSGLLMGFQPQVAGALEAVTPSSMGGTSYSEGRDEAQRLNDKAFSDNPLAYGAGYGLGTVATAPAGGILMRGGAMAGRAFAGTRMGEAAIDAAKAARMGIAERNGTVFDKLRNVPGPGPTPAPSKIDKVIDAATDVITNRAAQQSTIRPTGAITNSLPPEKKEEPKKVSSNPFAGLIDFLAQAETSDNPNVKELAAKAQEDADIEDEPNKKRRIAMALQQTKEGRAISNSESPERNA